MRPEPSEGALVQRSHSMPTPRGHPYGDPAATGFRHLAGACAVASPLVFSAAWLAAWTAQETYSPRREDISALAALDAQQPWIMISGFLALALGLTALGAGLLRTVAGGRAARAGALLVVLAGLGILVAGIARNDCSSELEACKARIDGGAVSWHHDLHDAVSGLVFLTLVVALLVLFIAGPIDGWNGLIQRVFLAVPLVWITVLGIRLRRLANDHRALPTS